MTRRPVTANNQHVMRFALKRWDYGVYVAAAGVSMALLPLPLAAFAAALGVLVVLIAIVDLDRYIIPDLAVLAMLILGLALVAVEGGRAVALLDAGLRALATGGALYLLRLAYRQFTGIDGLGLGDVKLAGAAGPWLMWPTLPFAIAVAAVAALVTTGARAALVRERLHLKQELPFGAFLAPAIWLSFLLERLRLLPV